MILTAELAAGTVTVDTTAGTWTLNGGDPRPIPAEWQRWVDDLAARATQASTDDAQIVAGVVQATEVHLATVAVIDGMLS